MKRLFFLLFLLGGVGGVAHAELTYFVYDLASPESAPVEISASDIKNKEYREGSKILFVRDSTVEVPGYMGVFEVTQAQANVLWGKVAEKPVGSAYGYNGTDFPGNHRLTNFPRLSYPTHAQWRAYAGDPATYCNVYNGGSYSLPVYLTTWYSNYDSKTTANAHGVLDAYGNVAEFASDTNLFYGGYAFGKCTFSSLSNDMAGEGYGGYAQSNKLLGARLVYTPPEEQTYTVTLSLDGTVLSGYPLTAKAGDAITLSPPTPSAGYRLAGPVITPETITSTSFTMPAENVSFAYTSRAYFAINVVNGTASQSEAFVGDVLTLSPALPAYRAFTAWTLPDGSSRAESTLSYTIPDSTFTPGSTLTFTAESRAYPRVYLFGGSAVIQDESGESLGAGYYTPGTVLKLSPDALTGYTFKAWEITSEGESTTSSDTSYTVGTYDSAVTLQATYDVSADPVTNPEITLIGEAVDSSPLVSATAFGYEALAMEELTTEGNTFHYYGTEVPTGDYALLDLVSTNLTYATSVANTAENKTKLLPMKRTTPASGQPYYVGIFETTVAHEEYMRPLAEEEAFDSAKTSSIFPTTTDSATRSNATTFLSRLSSAFGTTFSLPSKGQIEGITQAGLQEGETYNGAGHLNVFETYGDKNITDGMVVCGRSSSSSYASAGSVLPDPYGFYDLWGNVAEMLQGSTNLWGGGCDETTPATCNLQYAGVSFGTNIPGAFRPAVEVQQKWKVTIAGLDETFEVLPGQVIQLAPQTRAGCAFLGWTATVGTTSTAVELDSTTGRYPYTVEADVTLTPSFSDAGQPVAITYVGCTGAPTLLPGASCAVYPPDSAFGYGLKTLTLTPASAGTVDLATGTITLSATATAPITVTATYATPRPGFLWLLQ